MSDSLQTDGTNPEQAHIDLLKQGQDVTPPATATADAKAAQKEQEAKMLAAVEAAKKEAAAEAAAIEKQKQYDTIKKKEEEAAELKAKLAEFEKKEQEAAAKAEEERVAKLTAEQKLAEEVATAKLKAEQTALALEKLKQETDAKLNRKDLELLKKDLIAEAGGKIISELVFGDSVEELKESAEKAKAKYQQIVDEVALETKTKTEQEKLKTTSTETPHTRHSHSKSDSSEPTSEEVLKMSTEKFAEYKEQKLQELGL